MGHYGTSIVVRGTDEGAIALAIKEVRALMVALGGEPKEVSAA